MQRGETANPNQTIRCNKAKAQLVLLRRQLLLKKKMMRKYRDLIC